MTRRRVPQQQKQVVFQNTAASVKLALVRGVRVSLQEAYYYRELFERHFPQTPARLTVPGGPSVACRCVPAAT